MYTPSSIDSFNSENTETPPPHARIKGGGAGDLDHPLKNHKNIGFLSNTGLNPLKIYKPTFNVRSLLARQRNITGGSIRDGLLKLSLYPLIN